MLAIGSPTFVAPSPRVVLSRNTLACTTVIPAIALHRELRRRTEHDSSFRQLLSTAVVPTEKSSPVAWAKTLGVKDKNGEDRGGRHVHVTLCHPLGGQDLAGYLTRDDKG